jgi:hypothetical protein
MKLSDFCADFKGLETSIAGAQIISSGRPITVAAGTMTIEAMKVVDPGIPEAQSTTCT